MKESFSETRSFVNQSAIRLHTRNRNRNYTVRPTLNLFKKAPQKSKPKLQPQNYTAHPTADTMKKGAGHCQKRRDRLSQPENT